MSRCFPYPPPGYCGERASYEALIESIKLQREREKAKAERKREKEERKREKEERKREKKEKKRVEETAKLSQDICRDEKAQKRLKSWADSKEGCEKRSEDSVELLERSDLTEEHELPVSLQKPCYSSDSTENSNKRKRNASPHPSAIGVHGNIIRFRLPLQKHKELDSGNEALCSTSGRTDLSAPLGADTVVQGRDEKLGSSTSGSSEIFARAVTDIASCSTPIENEMQRKNSTYEDLIRSWVPPALQSQLSDFDDQEWLFGRKHQGGKHGEKRYKASGDVSCCSRSTLWPHAQFLPEADIYALPFTVPF